MKNYYITKMYRLKTLTKLFILFIIVVFFLILWNIVFPTKTNFKHTCIMTDDYLIKLEELLLKIHNILDSAGITHILCYGTLWGQIRISKLLPWSKKGDFCIFQEELDRIDDDFFSDIFTRNNLNINYNKMNGIFVIKDEVSVIKPNSNNNNIDGPFVELIVFKRDETQNVYKRTGWIRGILPPTCDWTPSLDCFPLYLLQKPLPSKLLGSHYYPVGMGGIELQKYHYPDNWWKEVRLKNCNLN